MIFIYSKLLYIFCFIILFTSSSPCRKDQLPFHVYFSTKYCFMLRTWCVRLHTVLHVVVWWESLRKVWKRSNVYLAFINSVYRGVIKGFFLVKKRKKKREAAVPIPGVEPGPPGWKPGILTARPYGIWPARIANSLKQLVFCNCPIRNVSHEAFRWLCPKSENVVSSSW